MKQRTKFFIALVIVQVFLFGCVAFIRLQANPFMWDRDVRTAYAILFFFGVVFSAFIVNLKPEDI